MQSFEPRGAVQVRVPGRRLPHVAQAACASCLPTWIAASMPRSMIAPQALPAGLVKAA
jgi:hypothetical protein